ncbi:MAG: hypothetical protein M1532_02480 [Nitrospirae bacterium]|nr:hypothetical protein [Nitrospirota bacterium]
MSSPSMSTGADTPSRVKELAAQGQSIWLDSISRDLMDSGKLDHLIRVVGIRGMTSNPTIFEKAINGSAAYDGEIAFLSRRGYNSQQILRVLMVRDIQRACDFFVRSTRRWAGRTALSPSRSTPFWLTRRKKPSPKPVFSIVLSIVRT